MCAIFTAPSLLLRAARVWLVAEELCEGLCMLAFLSGDPSLPGDGGPAPSPRNSPWKRSGRWWLLGKEATRIAVRAVWDVSRGDVNVEVMRVCPACAWRARLYISERQKCSAARLQLSSPLLIVTPRGLCVVLPPWQAPRCQDFCKAVLGPSSCQEPALCILCSPGSALRSRYFIFAPLLPAWPPWEGAAH